MKNYSTIENGTFNGTVTNEGANATIKNGTFEQEVINNDGEITGGTFAAGLSANHNTVTGGAFNGNTGLTGARHVTVTGGSLLKVNGVVTTGTAWDLYSYKDTTMTITASTDIYSLNDQPLSTNPYNSSQDSNDKTTVTFTLPNEDVVLGTGDLVMAGGYPVGTSGKGWSYDSSTQTLTLTDGTFDFSFTYPQNAKGAGAEPVKCAIESYATISGGIFDKAVTNDTEGMISGNGTFKGEVKTTMERFLAANLREQ